MRKSRLAQLFSILFTLSVVISLPGGVQAQESDEQTLWKMEHLYWDYVQNNDLTAYRGLWHKDFVGWPSVSATPVNKEHITDWITDQTGQGRTFKMVEFKPASIHVNGDVAVTYYWVTYRWVNKDGGATTRTIRVTHTLVREGKDWHILGGMSMPEAANPQK